MKRWRAAVLPLFCGQFLLLEAALRGARALEVVTSAGAAVAAFQSVCLWLALGWAARSGRGPRAVAALLAGAALALQGLFFRRFGQWVDAQVIRSAVDAWRDLAPSVRAEAPRLAGVALGCAAAEYALLHADRPRAKERSRLRLAAAPALLFAVFVPLSLPAKGPPDLRLAGAAFDTRVSAAGAASAPAVALPALPPARSKLPSVVLIVTESVRADEYCSAPAAQCKVAPAVNAALPERIAFPEMRSLASYTAVSMALLVTGRTQEIGRRELFSSPTLFDAVKAIPTGAAAPYTAYWSSHYWPIFHWDDPKRSVDSYVTREDLYPPGEDGEDGDARLAAYAVKRLAELPSPYFVVLHFHDTHLLYAFDEEGAPFQPWTRKVSWETMPALRNAYRNAIHHQDRSIAAVVDALRKSPRWPSTFVLFTSDHGESFGEHGQIHHGQDLLDEQVHVPGWAAFGDEAVTADEATALRANAGAFLTHLDVAPTVLDLFGLPGSYGLLEHVRRMPGRSLLRPITAPPPAVAMTNCSEAFPCPWSTWGVLRGDRKLEAQAWDFGWNCHRLGEGEEALSFGDEGCVALVREARSRFARLPNGATY